MLSKTSLKNLHSNYKSTFTEVKEAFPAKTTMPDEYFHQVMAVCSQQEDVDLSENVIDLLQNPDFEKEEFRDRIIQNINGATTTELKNDQINTPKDYFRNVLAFHDIKSSPYNTQAILERFKLHDHPYLVNPMEQGYRRAVEVMGLVFWFISKLKRTTVKAPFDHDEMQNFLLGFSKVDPITASIMGSNIDGSDSDKLSILDVYKTSENANNYFAIQPQSNTIYKCNVRKQ